jgi:hypothetical protein
MPSLFDETAARIATETSRPITKDAAEASELDLIEATYIDGALAEVALYLDGVFAAAMTPTDEGFPAIAKIVGDYRCSGWSVSKHTDQGSKSRLIFTLRR